MNYIGEYVDLKINRFTSVGAFLEDEEGFEVLLPNKYLLDGWEVGDSLTVFIYNDSEDRPVATTETPKFTLHGYAFLEVRSVGRYGAFLDWGLEKDLLVPYKEQNAKMIEGGHYLVRLELDRKTNRLIGTARINRFLSNQVKDLEQGDEVQLLTAEKTDLGQKVIVNNKYSGLIFNNHISRPLEGGMRIKGYVEFIRQDGKIDISLNPIGNEKFDLFTEKLFQYLKENNGSIPITDKSSPEEIRACLNMSKKSFKKAVGNLYKRRIIKLLDSEIQLTGK